MWLESISKKYRRCVFLDDLLPLGEGESRLPASAGGRICLCLRSTTDLPPDVRPPFKFLHADQLIGVTVRGSGGGDQYPASQMEG